MNTSARESIQSEPGHAPLRRRRSVAEKRRIVEATLAPGTSVAKVAREHGINANLVFGWRRLYQRGLLGGNVPLAAALVPVKLTDNCTPPPEPSSSPIPSGFIQLRLPKGQLRIEGSVDAASLRVVLECLIG